MCGGGRGCTQRAAQTKPGSTWGQGNDIIQKDKRRIIACDEIAGRVKKIVQDKPAKASKATLTESNTERPKARQSLQGQGRPSQ